jgi:hypothetical protein
MKEDWARYSNQQTLCRFSQFGRLDLDLSQFGLPETTKIVNSNIILDTDFFSSDAQPNGLKIPKY